MEESLQQKIMIMMTQVPQTVLCYILVPGGLVAVIIAIPMVSMVLTHMEKESTGAHGRVIITLSNIFSSKYVKPESASICINSIYAHINIDISICVYISMLLYANICAL